MKKKEAAKPAASAVQSATAPGASPATRRRFLSGAAAATASAAALGFPHIARGQTGPVNLRIQSTWPSKDIFHEMAGDLVKKVDRKSTRLNSSH